jgi:hypothetical protein
MNIDFREQVCFAGRLGSAFAVGFSSVFVLVDKFRCIV